ncbi:hypothetical protein [Salinibacterium sp. ZJ77]|uniref:hypothetical protein n=1 Tax=Salinibacterium sp. ZJ77 TaxID=2708337 RepID=UPI00141F6503|nr:hypothetical protein [Salinibacterium sp. ZJ77]
MTAAPRPGFPLGIGVPPADGDELARRVITTLRDGANGVRIEPIEDAAVTAVVSGFDIIELAVEVTGAHVARVPTPDDADPGDGFDGVPEQDARPAVTVGRGLAQRIRVQGAPVLVVDTPVVLDADITQVPIRWVRRDDDVLELRDDLDSPAADGPRGHARLSVAGDAVPLLVDGFVRDIAGPEWSLDDVVLTFADAGEDAVGFEGEAQVTMAALGARVSLSGVLRVVDGSRLRLEGFDIRSRSFFAAAALAALGPRIAEATSQELDLASVLPVGLSGARVGIGSPNGGLELAATFS